MQHKFGRSSLDHHSASCLVRIGEIAQERGEALHLALIAANPYRVAFLPQAFDPPIETSYVEEIAGQDVRISVGSAARLLAELREVGDSLGVPLEGGELSDDTARRIDDLEKLPMWTVTLDVLPRHAR